MSGYNDPPTPAEFYWHARAETAEAEVKRLRDIFIMAGDEQTDLAAEVKRLQDKGGMTVEDLEHEIIALRNKAAALGLDDQWRRFATAAAVIDELTREDAEPG